MEFKEFRNKQRAYLDSLFSGEFAIFRAAVEGDKLWETYLNSFPEGTNPIFRTRTDHDCSCCRAFIKQFGNVLVWKNGALFTIWGFDTGSPDKYQPVVNALNQVVLSSPISNVFVTKENLYGVENSKELDKESGRVITWNHFYFPLPSKLVYKGHDTLDTLMAGPRVNRELLFSSMQQISEEAVETVLDLISSNSLYRGEEWQGPLTRFLSLRKEYEKLPTAQTQPNNVLRNNWLWIKSLEAGPAISRIKNHSIGTLLLDLSNEEELDVALRKYEKVVAPQNYKRPTAIFTKKMVEEAQRTVVELGLLDSLPRRFATLDDISINDVLFADRSIMSRLGGGDVFGKLGASFN